VDDGAATIAGHATAAGSGSPVDMAHAVVAAMTSLVETASATFAPGWAFEERAGVIESLDRLTALVGVYRAGVLAAHKQDGRWAGSGDRSFEAFRGRTTRTGTGAARAEMELAEGLAALPQAAAAIEAGRVGLGHAEVLTRLRARSSQRVRDALDAGGAAELLAAAAQVDVPTFAKRAAAWAAARDADAAEASFAAVRARRYLRVIERDGGARLDGFVDPVVGATFRAALEALTPEPAVDDERTSDQRAADALATLAGRALDAGADKIGAQIRPHLSLLVPAEAWVASRRGRGRTAESGDGRGVVAMPELDDGTVLPLSELERLACDCEITRLVLDADGVPLDVGQTERTYSKGLRRAVLVRDGHCQWPGCTLRASWCEVHHIEWFSRGGATSIENGLTLCVFHHHEVHRRHITITPIAGGHVFVRADGSTLGTATREADVGRLSGTGRSAQRPGGTTRPPSRVDPVRDGAARDRDRDRPGPDPGLTTRVARSRGGVEAP